MSFIAKLKDVISDDSELLTEGSELAPYLQSTEGFTRAITAVVKVRNKQDIASLLKLANTLASDPQNRFTIYPVSTGNNWGYGSSLPSTVSGKVVLLDLKDLNKIIFFDEENGLCTIEPGVTQQQMYEFLLAKNSAFMTPVTGAGPDCSILSNALERGYGITPNPDHFAAVMNIKGYLPSGDFYTSPLNELDKSEGKYADKAFKWKLGPYLEGIFTQSGNLVATEITIKLEALPNGFDSFYMRFFDKDSFDTAYGVVNAIFNQVGSVVGSINLMDKRRVVAMVGENPQGSGNHVIMTDEQVEHIAKANDVPEWTIIGTIYGCKSVSKAAKSEIRKIAKGKANQIIFSNSLLVNFGRWALHTFPFPFLAKYREQIDKLDMGMDIMKGIPNRIALPLAYWRNPTKQASGNQLLDPAQDKCGLLWYAPLIPTKPASMKIFINLVRTTCSKYNIEPMITFTNFSAQTTDSTIPIVFDLSSEQAKNDAHNCVEELVAEGLTHGFVPYRLNIEQQQNLLNPQATCWKTSVSIKQALDPNGVLSPNRYNPQ